MLEHSVSEQFGLNGYLVQRLQHNSFAHTREGALECSKGAQMCCQPGGVVMSELLTEF